MYSLYHLPGRPQALFSCPEPRRYVDIETKEMKKKEKMRMNLSKKSSMEISTCKCEMETQEEEKKNKKIRSHCDRHVENNTKENVTLHDDRPNDDTRWRHC